MRRIKIHIPVWGESHTDTFLRVCLPACLAPGNIREIANKHDVTVLVSCDAETRARISEHQALKELQSIAVVRYDIWPKDVFHRPPYEIMSLMHQRLVRTAKLDDELVFLNPDVIISSSYLSSIVSLMSEDVDAVLMHNFRINKETVLPLLEQRIGSDGSLQISERELVALGLLHVHHSSRCIFWDGSGAGYAAWHIGMRCGERSLVSSMFHPHPAIVRIKNLVDSFTGTIDHELVSKVTRGKDCLMVADSSSLGVILEVSACSYDPFINDHYCAVLIEPQPEAAVPWALQWTNKQHHHCSSSLCLLWGETHDPTEQDKLKVNEASIKVRDIRDKIMSGLEAIPSLKLTKSAIDQMTWLNKKSISLYYEQLLFDLLNDRSIRYNKYLFEQTYVRITQAIAAGVDLSRHYRESLMKKLRNAPHTANQKQLRKDLLPEDFRFSQRILTKLKRLLKAV